jgi:hypothetical protein
MSFRGTAAWVAAVVILFTVADTVLYRLLGEHAQILYRGSVRVAWLAVVMIATAAVAARFRWWGDYIGRVWTLLSVEYLCLTASETIRRFAPSLSPIGRGAVVIGNLAGIAAFWLLARSLHAAGLRYSGARSLKLGFFAIAAVLTAVLVLEPSVREVRRLLAGTGELDRAVSVLSDLVTFILVAPLLLTAHSFRGGRLFGVYALLTAGTIGWMINQGSGTLLTFLGMTGATRAGQMFGFAMACACIAGAAYVQGKGTGSEVVHA